MRLSMAHSSGDRSGTAAAAPDLFHTLGRRITLLVTAILMLACVGTLISSPKKAGADTVYASGQVFASVGNATVNVYDQNSGDLINSLTDSTGDPYVAGSAFDASGDLFVADDLNGDVSEFAPDGTPLGQVASGLDNPLSIAFDNQGDMYVGQQSTPYIAEYSPGGQRLPDIGPVATELTGDDWIDLSPRPVHLLLHDRESDILTYNKCTNTQGPNFNVATLPGDRTRSNCRSFPTVTCWWPTRPPTTCWTRTATSFRPIPALDLNGCQGMLFAVALDPTARPSGRATPGPATSGRSTSPPVRSMQTINTHSGMLYGLSIADEIEVATRPPAPTTSPTT